MGLKKLVKSVAKVVAAPAAFFTGGTTAAAAVTGNDIKTAVAADLAGLAAAPAIAAGVGAAGLGGVATGAGAGVAGIAALGSKAVNLYEQANRDDAGVLAPSTGRAYSSPQTLVLPMPQSPNDPMPPWMIAAIVGLISFLAIKLLLRS